MRIDNPFFLRSESEFLRVNSELLQHGVHGSLFELVFRIAEDSPLLTEIKRSMTALPAVWCKRHLRSGPVAEVLDLAKEFGTFHVFLLSDKFVR